MLRNGSVQWLEIKSQERISEIGVEIQRQEIILSKLLKLPSLTTNQIKRMNTLDQISIAKYGKPYTQLPDDGAEQDHVQHEFDKQWEECKKCGDIFHPGEHGAANNHCSQCVEDALPKSWNRFGF